jgi:hypothetical protein
MLQNFGTKRIIRGRFVASLCSVEESSNTFTAKVEVEMTVIDLFPFFDFHFVKGPSNDPVPSVTGKLVSFFKITFIGLEVFTFIGPNRVLRSSWGSWFSIEKSWND